LSKAGDGGRSPLIWGRCSGLRQRGREQISRNPRRRIEWHYFMATNSPLFIAF
jgi:hypothetical protein